MNEISPEQKLWQEVVLRALLDAMHPGGNNTHRDQVQATREAKVWIDRGGKDFQGVCHMAGLDPDFIREAYRGGKINRRALQSGREAAA